MRSLTLGAERGEAIAQRKLGSRCAQVVSGHLAEGEKFLGHYSADDMSASIVFVSLAAPVSVPSGLELFAAGL